MVLGVYAKTINARSRVLRVKHLNAWLEHVVTERSVLFQNASSAHLGDINDRESGILSIKFGN